MLLTNLFLTQSSVWLCPPLQLIRARRPSARWAPLHQPIASVWPQCRAPTQAPAQSGSRTANRHANPPKTRSAAPMRTMKRVRNIFTPLTSIFTFVEIRTELTALHPSPSRWLHEYPQCGERARGVFAQGDGTASFLQPRHRLGSLAARGPPHHHAAQPQVAFPTRTHACTEIHTESCMYKQAQSLTFLQVLFLL